MDGSGFRPVVASEVKTQPIAAARKAPRSFRILQYYVAKMSAPQKDLRSKSNGSENLEFQNGHAQGTVWARRLFRRLLSKELQA